MKHLMPSLCLALLLVETACSAPSSVTKKSNTEKNQKSSITRQNAENAYRELDGNMTATVNALQSNATEATGTEAISLGNAAEKTALDNAREVLQDYTQPIIMVSPALNAKGETQEIVTDNYSNAVQEAIHSYLTKKNYEVKSVEGQETLNEILQMQNDIANTEDDLSYLAGIALDADIYIKFKQEVTNDEVSVELSAYEASTARLLGSQTSTVRNNGHTSKINIASNLGAAVRKAMPGLETKILSYWKNDLSKGNQYKVVINIKGEYSDSQTEDLHDAIMKGLKGNFNSVKVNVMTAKTLDFVIYSSAVKYKDPQEVYSKIRQILKPLADTKKNNITRKLILMELN